MKRLGNKVVAMFISTVMLATTFTMTAFAAQISYNNAVDELSQAEIREEIINIVKSTSSADEREALLSKLLQNNPLQEAVSAQNTRAVNSVSILETVEVDDNVQIDFFSNGNFGIQELEEIGTTEMKARAINYTNTHRASYTITNGIGGKIVETYVKGYFAYDNTNTPVAYITDAGYSKGTLIMWECGSWEDGTASNSRDKEAYCYADAYYHWTIGGEGGSSEVGATVSGGFTIQDCNIFLKLNCDKNGDISASVAIEG